MQVVPIASAADAPTRPTAPASGTSPAGAAPGAPTGLDVLREYVAAPERVEQPVDRLLGIRLVEVDHGRAVVEMHARADLLNGQGVLHGGMYATALDSACASASYSTVSAGTRMATTDLTVKYLRPAAIETGALRCEARVLHRGRRNIVLEARMTDPTERLLACASCTIMIVTD
ncbi:PaaI family thioesterase [Streptomyces abyssomicinicus]|uniref:PaaI family thioesterase n=1 Tax=Streptomyces abyssomicinicus TaxID=574929 RepID=UPI001250AE5C|nr:PaaI family thioesterase [Streptomyces abyssomicinicus]